MALWRYGVMVLWCYGVMARFIFSNDKTKDADQMTDLLFRRYLQGSDHLLSHFEENTD